MELAPEPGARATLARRTTARPGLHRGHRLPHTARAGSASGALPHHRVGLGAGAPTPLPDWANRSCDIVHLLATSVKTNGSHPLPLGRRNPRSHLSANIGRSSFLEDSLTRGPRFTLATSRSTCSD